MPPGCPTYIGIDLAADTGHGQRVYSYAALDQDLRLLAIGQGSQNDALAYAGGQAEAMVAINAPRRPNMGLMRQDTVRRQLSPPPKPGTWMNYRMAEYQLSLPNVPVLPTPADLDRCPPWMRAGFEFFHQLELVGYQPYPAPDELRQSLEVHPHASFCALLGRAPFQRETLEGRLQRQLVLKQQGVRITDPMDFFEEVTRFKLLKGILPLESIYTPEMLDALVAAYTAWLAGCKAEEVALLGSPEEGQIVLPALAAAD